MYRDYLKNQGLVKLLEAIRFCQETGADKDIDIINLEDLAENILEYEAPKRENPFDSDEVDDYTKGII